MRYYRGGAESIASPLIDAAQRRCLSPVYSAPKAGSLAILMACNKTPPKPKRSTLQQIAIKAEDGGFMKMAATVVLSLARSTYMSVEEIRAYSRSCVASDTRMNLLARRCRRGSSLRRRRDTPERRNETRARNMLRFIGRMNATERAARSDQRAHPSDRGAVIIAGV